MADIISIDDRLKEQREKQLSEQKKRRQDTLRMIMQCTTCPFKCAKCGSQLEAPQPRVISPELPLRLCLGCWEEFLLFQQTLAGAAKTPMLEPYYNAAWAEVWKTWLDYQKRLHRYRLTPEFQTLVEELSREEE